MATTFEEIAEPKPTSSRHHHEDVVTSNIEKYTSKIPSGVYLAAGLASIAVSAGFAMAGKKQTANFIGMWVPTILIMGLYNKIVKHYEPE